MNTKRSRGAAVAVFVGREERDRLRHLCQEGGLTYTRMLKYMLDIVENRFEELKVGK